MMIELRRGDITEVSDVDAIVNAANESLLGGGGVDGAIHQAAGPELLEATRQIGGCPTGQARITEGYRLPVPYIIHTVGPLWQGGNHGEAALLASAYRSSLDLANQYKLKRLAFPSISTGVYSYPLAEASELAIKTVNQALAQPDCSVDYVCWVLYDEKTYQAYQTALDRYS